MSKYLQRLCCLGLGGQVLIPALLRELHALVPSCSNFFFWTDGQGEVINGSSEEAAHTLFAYYFAEFYKKRELDVMPLFDQWVRQNHGVTTLRRFAKPELEASDFYNEIFRSLNYRDATYSLIKDEHHRPLGVLGQGFDAIYEPSSREVKVLEALIPYIAHGLTQAQPMDTLETGAAETGLLIFNSCAQLQHISLKGRELLYLATHAEISPKTTAGEKPGRLGLPPELIRIVQAMSGIFQNGADSGGAPVWRCRNNWGSFVFRAYWLEGHDRSNALIGVTLQREVPMLLVLYDKVKALDLTSKQREVCLYLAYGHSKQAIATHLRISEAAVVWHAREIYGRLNVHNKSELHKALLNGA